MEEWYGLQLSFYIIEIVSLAQSAESSLEREWREWTACFFQIPDGVCKSDRWGREMSGKEKFSYL